MARIRSIHPDACDSEKLGAITADAERLYWRLQTHCDDEGRCEDNPRLIWARCIPLVDGWTAKKVDAALDELHAAGLLVRYRVAGDGYVEVAQWARFQHPQKPKPSVLPSPADADTMPVRDEYATGPVAASSGGEGRGEGDGEERERHTLALAIPDPEPTFDDFWNVYPKKVCKVDAQRAWDKATTRGKTRPTTIVDGLKAQLPKFRNSEPEFIPHAATWLNGGRWNDEIPKPSPLGKNQSVLESLAGVQ